MTKVCSTLSCRENKGVRWVEFPGLDASGRLLAIVTTRHGGVSDGGFQSLNLSYSVGDDPERVADNRGRVFEANGIDPGHVSYVKQVHRNRVVEPAIGSGPSNTHTIGTLEADGQVTDRRGVALFLTFADCVPLLAFDPRRAVVGLAHAGWRGTLNGIGRELVSTMEERFGSRPEDVHIGIGPSIGPCCYEVGDDVAQQFRDRWPSSSNVISGGESRPRVDLWTANRLVLTEARIRPENVWSSQVCTSCQVDEFFSHRRQRGTAGRFAAIVMLR